MKRPYIVYTKNKTESEFTFRTDITSIYPTKDGYRITFNNDRSYNYRASRVKFYQWTESKVNVRIYVDGVLNRSYDTVDYYGSLLILRNERYSSLPLENGPHIEVLENKLDFKKEIQTLDYFKNILSQSIDTSFDIPLEVEEKANPNQVSSTILLKALEEIDLGDSRSALSNYINGVNPSVKRDKRALIYPFGCNESQKLAVETALVNGFSIIEGPPGTGKTQTILNIIANLVMQGKTIAIASNNNSAVFNVQEKLEKYGYGMLVASLGNKENREIFFDTKPIYQIEDSYKLSSEELIQAKHRLNSLEEIVSQNFTYRNRLATAKSDLTDAKIEFAHIKKEQPLDGIKKNKLDRAFRGKWTVAKLINFSEYLSKAFYSNRKMTVFERIKLVFSYGLLNIKSIQALGDDAFLYINHKFYDLYIDNLENEIYKMQDWLNSHDEKQNLDDYIEVSKRIFNHSLYKRYKKLGATKFSLETYKGQFEKFVKHYPVITSSTLSLHTSIPKDYLFDFLIIDEASQVDIIKSAVCFSCARNAIVVGDSMQLSHIVDAKSKNIAEELLVRYQLNSAYNYVVQNILGSLKELYGENIKSVLLKEHYRCHPTIIAYCNKKYYNNNLVVMTSGESYPFKIIETNISGARDLQNQRQIDETNLYIQENYSDDYAQVGVISPYRNHADALQRALPKGAEADTIHKFQGREKDVIIFNTVLDKINDFIDNPNLINVAISRAVKEFIVVKPKQMELPHGTNIGDLIRYMCYTATDESIVVKGSVCSVFDLLYKEYSHVLTPFLDKNKMINGSPAEVIIHKLLQEDILHNNKQFSAIDMVREYKLRDLIRSYDHLSEEEVLFIKNNSRIDFLLYNKIDKTPVLAIEVDGVSFHDNEAQMERDRKKDRILEVLNLPLLRLSTNGHDEEERIIMSLQKAMGIYPPSN